MIDAIQTSTSLWTTSLILSLTGVAQAQITPTPPFDGAISESFETLTSDNGLDECLDLSTGPLCSLPGTTALGLVDNFISTGCTLGAFEGETFLVKIDSSIPVLGSDSITWTFPEPVARFGGWFADAGLSGSTTTVRFFDASGSLLSEIDASFATGCAWEWIGFSAIAGSEFSSVELVHDSAEDFGLLIDDLQVDLEGDGGGGLGTDYCVSTANSTGSAAGIFATGSLSVQANSLALGAQPVPDQPGLFYYGPSQILAPFGDGFRCVGGQVGRLAISTGSNGVLSTTVDLDNPPSAATQITAGSTWNFQAWYRDPAAGGSGFNLSNGLELTFLP